MIEENRFYSTLDINKNVLYVHTIKKISAKNSWYCMLYSKEKFICDINLILSEKKCILLSEFDVAVFLLGVS